MANWVGALEAYNPYITQIPTEAFTKVGIAKQQLYESGIEKVQSSVDRVAGLDIANEGGRQYLRSRVDELTKNLNKYSNVDFSNANNVSQLVSLAKPLYQDENIVNDVINTGVYRKWSKEASENFKNGKMELGQFARESADASKWLNSNSAGADYTGRATPNTATKKELTDRIVKAKKAGFEKNEYVYDRGYSIDTPYYIKSTDKHYSEADFNNFVSDALMSSKDREMLQNDHWYENQGVPTPDLQKQDIEMYQSKIDANNKRIENIKNDPLLYAGNKKVESQKVIDDLTAYNKQLSEGKIKFLKNLNLSDPTSRDVFHRDLAETRYMNSLHIMMDETHKEEYQKNEQWFEDKKLQIELAKEAVKATTKAESIGKKKGTLDEQINEVSAFTPVLPNAPKTELSLNVIQKGWQMKNDEINTAMNGLVGKLQENGVDMSQFIAGWDQVQVGNKAGASMNVPRFKDQASKDKFYNMVAGINFAYTKEAEDGHIDNKSFNDWVKQNVAGYNDDDPNSKFTLADKVVSDALNTLKGTSALLPRLDQLFSDKGVVRTMAQIDESLKDKKDMANAYREAMFKSGALSGDEINSLKKMSDEDLLGKGAFYDKSAEEKKHPDARSVVDFEKQSDGTYAIVNNFYGESKFSGPADVIDKHTIAQGFKSESEARSAFDKVDNNTGGYISNTKGISSDSLDKAEKFVKQTYSYIQEDLNTSMADFKSDKDAYSGFTDALNSFITKSKLASTARDIQIDGNVNPNDLTAINEVEAKTFSVNNTEDIFNVNPMVEVNFKATIPTKNGAEEKKFSGRVSLKSFLATNPNYRTSEYAKYFAPALYAEKDAFARIKSAVNPLEGSEASYANRKDINPVFNRINQQGQSQFVEDSPEGKTPSGSAYYGNDIQWETIPIEKDNKQTMVSYQVVSLGQNTDLGNLKTKDGQTYQKGAFYVKIKIPTSTGDPKVIFLKRPNGDSYTFNTASDAHYTVRDLIFNNSDVKLDELDPKTGDINYFTTDPTTLRGIFNSQLSYNGFSKLETIKIKDAIGKEVEKQQAKQLQYAK